MPEILCLRAVDLDVSQYVVRVNAHSLDSELPSGIDPVPGKDSSPEKDLIAKSVDARKKNGAAQRTILSPPRR